ncbi:Spo0B domain-containing protein [Chengkuizengella sp. SCS-71B]|uniref:Spo0B domain-containing protein n=1 Tax=Chengkuizengella sp. SCS-71B TaxID=3115290 RepID=UPI0032C2424F
MGNWKRKSLITELLVLLLLLFIFITSNGWLSRILIMITVILIIFHFFVRKKQKSSERDQSVSETLSFIHHYQHDLMNELQLIFGYIKLKKFDKLIFIVEKLKESIQQERNIAKLNTPFLEFVLLKMKTNCKSYQFKVEQSLNYPEKFTNQLNDHVFLLIELLNLFESYAKNTNDSDNELMVDFFEEQEKLHVAFEFVGKMNLTQFKNDLDPIVMKFKTKRLKIKEEVNEKWISIEIQFD